MLKLFSIEVRTALVSVIFILLVNLEFRRLINRVLLDIFLLLSDITNVPIIIEEARHGFRRAVIQKHGLYIFSLWYFTLYAFMIENRMVVVIWALSAILLILRKECFEASLEHLDGFKLDLRVIVHLIGHQGIFNQALLGNYCYFRMPLTFHERLLKQLFVLLRWWWDGGVISWFFSLC